MTDVTVVTVLAGQGPTHVPVWPHGPAGMRHDGRAARTGGSAGPPPRTGANPLLRSNRADHLGHSGVLPHHRPGTVPLPALRRRPAVPAAPGRRFLTLFFIPVIPLTRAGEHVQCTTCRARYHVGALRAPTAAQMQAALPAGMRAAASRHAPGGRPGPFPARHRAIHAITGAGAQALRRRRPGRRPGRARRRVGAGPGPGGRPARGPGQGMVPRRGGQDRDGGRPAQRRRARGGARGRRRAWA